MIEAPTDVTLVDQALWTDDSAMEDAEIVGLSFGKATSSTSNLSKEDFFAIMDDFSLYDST